MPRANSKRTTKRRLTAKQQRFVEEYLTDLNATQAYIRAYSRPGYVPSTTTAKNEGSKTLAKPYIQEAIQKGRKNLSKRTEVTQERVIMELARLAFLDPRAFFDDEGNLIPITQLPDEAAAAVAGMDVFEEFEGKGEDRVRVGFTKKIKLTRKEKALEMLSRHLGLFDDKVTLDFSAETLNAILSGLPDELAGRVREALSRLVSRGGD